MKEKSKSKSIILEHISPMLCTLVQEPPTDSNYLFELKWDGYRIISKVENGKVRMNSRSGLDYTKRYPPIEEALKLLGHNIIIDGEVVVFTSEGKPDFDAIQLYNGHESPIQYCVFDLLWLDGHDLQDMPLVKRKELLKSLVVKNSVLKFSESYDDGKELYQKTLDLDLEGIIAKDKNSPYLPGSRG